MESTQGEREKSYQRYEIREPLKRVNRGIGLGDRNWGRKECREDDIARAGNDENVGCWARAGFQNIRNRILLLVGQSQVEMERLTVSSGYCALCGHFLHVALYFKATN